MNPAALYRPPMPTNHTRRPIWHVIIISDTGREIPHWTCGTRARARAEALSVRAMAAVPVRVVVRKGVSL